MEGVEIGNLQIPIAKGDAGEIIGLQVTMLASTATPTVVNSGTTSKANYTLGIPRGIGVASATTDGYGHLIITLTDGTSLDVGVVVGTSISNIYLDEEYNLIVQLTDSSSIEAGNLETAFSQVVNDYLADYYDKDTADSMFALIDEAGNKISLDINPTTYVVTATLKDKNNNTLDSDTIDLPLESVVVSGYYDNATKKVILTLQNGSTVDFSVADLVAGLQSEITNANKLSSDLVDDTNKTHKFVTASDITNWNAKADISDIPDLTNYVTNTDYANNNVGGTIKTSSNFNTFTQGGVLKASSCTGSDIWGNSVESYGFASIGSVKNAINYKIGDIDSALDAINGEVIS